MLLRRVAQCLVKLTGVLCILLFSALLFTSNASAQSLTTVFSSNNQYAGNMFNLTNLTSDDLQINSFDINVTSDVSDKVNVAVYYHAGGYAGYESTSSAWTLLGTTSVTANGADVPTPICVGSFILPAGSTYGLYITLTNYSRTDNIRMKYTNGTTSYSNTELRISDSIGTIDTLFSARSIDDRIWNGTIYYSEPSDSVYPQTGDINGKHVGLWLFLIVGIPIVAVRLYKKATCK